MSDPIFDPIKVLWTVRARELDKEIAHLCSRNQYEQKQKAHQDFHKFLRSR